MPFKINPFSNRLDEVADGGSSPDIPTAFETDDGTAVPASNLIIIRASPPFNGSTVQFNGAGQQILLEMTDDNDNIFIGRVAGSVSGLPTTLSCIGIGAGALQNANGAQNCVAIGQIALNASVSNTLNTAIGYSCLATGTDPTNFNGNTGVGANCLAGATNRFNVGVGYQCLEALADGVSNSAFGQAAGINYIGSESSNLLLKNPGVIGDNNTMRLGETGVAEGQVNRCFVAGVTGVSITGGATVLCDSNGQFGTVVSSVKYKENIEDINDKTSILNLNPVRFNYKSDEKKTPTYGFIAEEAEKVCRDLCIYGLDGEIESFKYHEMPALLLKEIQRLNQRIDVLYDLILDDSVA